MSLSLRLLRAKVMVILRLIQNAIELACRGLPPASQKGVLLESNSSAGSFFFYILVCTNEPIIGPHKYKPLLLLFSGSPRIKSLFEMEITCLHLLICLLVISDHINVTIMSAYDLQQMLFSCQE